MKKCLAFILVFLLTPLFAHAEIKISHDQAGNFCSISYYEHGNSYDVSPVAFPYSFSYCGKEIAVSSCAFYQAKISHGYHPFFHIHLDVSQLSDDEIYWLRKDDIRPFAFYRPGGDSDENEVFSTLLDLLWTDTKEIDIVFFDSSAYRYSFDSGSIISRLTIDHPKGEIVSFNSEDVRIDETCIQISQSAASPKDLSTMEAGLLEWVKKKLSEKGLSI